MTASHFADNSFIGIDVGGSSLDVAWHRGDSAHYANRPDAIAALVKRLMKQPVTRIVIEPTGGYEKALVKALREAQLPLEIVHTTRFKAYRELLASKPNRTRRMPGCWPPTPPLPTTCVAARPATSNCRKMRSAKHFLNSPAGAISSST
jgi:hypothetical protein